MIAMQERTEGWYEAIVDEQSADMLTLRWRDYPRERRIIRHRNSVGLLYRPLEPGQPKDKTAGATKNHKPSTPGSVTAVSASGAETAVHPVTWDHIAINQLVLAKQEGPWEPWWEAIVVEIANDMLTLQWRDFPKIARAVRPRLAVALLKTD